MEERKHRVIERKERKLGGIPEQERAENARLKESIIDSLSHFQDLDTSRVTINVKDSAVFLEGEADNMEDKRQIEHVADATIGVAYVDSRLRVKKRMFEKNE